MKIDLNGRNITIENIVWDTDGEQTKLPTTIVIPAERLNEVISDFLTDQTGCCVADYEASVIAMDDEEIKEAIVDAYYARFPTGLDLCDLEAAIPAIYDENSNIPYAVDGGVFVATDYYDPEYPERHGVINFDDGSTLTVRYQNDAWGNFTEGYATLTIGSETVEAQMMDDPPNGKDWTLHYSVEGRRPAEAWCLSHQ